MTQGKTYFDNEETWAAAYAVDKDFSTQAVTETYDGKGWLKLGFDKTFFIEKIILHNMFYNDWYDPSYECMQTKIQFTSCVDSDTNVDVSVYRGEVKQKSCGALQLNYGLEQSDQIYTLICNTEGDSVKLSKSTGNLKVFEVILTGYPSGKFT